MEKKRAFFKNLKKNKGIFPKKSQKGRRQAW
jgi:hypothetical protein